jgi:hypothetical protein
MVKRASALFFLGGAPSAKAFRNFALRNMHKFSRYYLATMLIDFYPKIEYTIDTKQEEMQISKKKKKNKNLLTNYRKSAIIQVFQRNKQIERT